MLCASGHVVFILLDQVDKTGPITIILGSTNSKFLRYFRGYIVSLNPVSAPYGSKNERARADTISPPIGDLHLGGDSLHGLVVNAVPCTLPG